jgi:hypothetical protein
MPPSPTRGRRFGSITLPIGPKRQAAVAVLFVSLSMAAAPLNRVGARMLDGFFPMEGKPAWGGETPFASGELSSGVQNVEVLCHFRTPRPARRRTGRPDRLPAR